MATELILVAIGRNPAKFGDVMKLRLRIRRFPCFKKGTIPNCKKRDTLFLFPGVLVGKGYITLFWLRSMLTVNFNTELIYDGTEPTDQKEL